MARAMIPLPSCSRVLVAACLSLCLALIASCTSVTPIPPQGPHDATEPFLSVPKPPDIVHVQMLPPPPDDQSVWVDGQWQWSGRHWKWQEGQWVQPQKKAHYAQPDFVLTPEADYQRVISQEGAESWVLRGYRAKLQFRPGRWYSTSDRAPAGSASPLER
jgi:hypothetical protein